ncbi:class I SAM-dependent methyltransferase [Pedobacter sp.]|uniref:class I SAM-dependent methyltransferase n=1 Tax=Pedobacter sp. TaxID=1411316 RepID=UPI003D7F5D0D
MEKELINDIVGWDVMNWSKAIDYWEQNTSISNKEYECLELGSSKGGMSLWLALNKNKVYCTDLNGPETDAYHMHSKHQCSSRITYGAVDATNIPYENHFDLVIFKSILGGISSIKNENKANTVNEIYKALKPGGTLLFAENLESTFLHKLLRKGYGTPNWNYLKLDELETVFAPFNSLNYTTVGFFGCFGRTEKQRNILGKVDALLQKLIPMKSKYILVGVAVK